MNTKVPKHITEWMRFETFLKELLKFTKELIDSLEGKNIDYEYQRVLYKFIQRFHLNFITIKNSWKEYLNNTKFRHPFYLLLRSLVSDYILMLYLIEGLKFEKKTKKPLEIEFKARYVEISNSYFIRLEKEIEKQIRDKKLTAKQREKFLKSEREFYPDHFENGDKIKIKKIGSSDPGTIIKKLKNGDYKKLTGIYQYYFYFSQYEHFTMKTEDLLDVRTDKEFEALINTVDYLIRGLLLNVGVMQLDGKLLDKLSKVIDGFEERFRK